MFLNAISKNQCHCRNNHDNTGLTTFYICECALCASMLYSSSAVLFQHSSSGVNLRWVIIFRTGETIMVLDAALSGRSLFIYFFNFFVSMFILR